MRHCPAEFFPRAQAAWAGVLCRGRWPQSWLAEPLPASSCAAWPALISKADTPLGWAATDRGFSKRALVSVLISSSELISPSWPKAAKPQWHLLDGPIHYAVLLEKDEFKEHVAQHSRWVASWSHLGNNAVCSNDGLVLPTRSLVS